jgi:hypothetical protein
MKHATLFRGALLALLIANVTVLAEGLSTEQYVALSIARLELARDSWTTTQQPPSAEAVAALFASYGIEESEYLTYASAHRAAIDAYLAAHQEERERIDALSTEIDSAIVE